jgi:mRNA-degrading endonuclease RelE of RelBE toxin-antitoxin system
VIWQLEWTEHAPKDARRLDRQVRTRVVRALDRLAETGQGDLIRLKDRRRQLRLRVGDWRVGLTELPETSVLRVDWVRPRGRAYRD